MPSRDCDNCQRLQTTIDHLARELAAERAEHRRTKDERDQALRLALRWRRVAQMIHQAVHPEETP